MSKPTNETLTALRTQALSDITPALKPTAESAPVWRTVFTDSESLTGIAPICNQPGSDALHEITDYPGGPIRDEDGVYDCCPWPQIETCSVAWAAYLVALLNADTGARQDGQAYDGELAMLRGLVRALRVAARNGELPEVQRMLMEHAHDDRVSRANTGEEASAPAPTATSFFQAGRTYQSRSTQPDRVLRLFRCTELTTHNNGVVTAHGTSYWAGPDLRAIAGSAVSLVYGQDTWLEGWTDITNTTTGDK